MPDETPSKAAARRRRDRWIIAALMLLGFVIFGLRAIPLLGPQPRLVVGTVRDARLDLHPDSGQRILALKVQLDDGRVIAVTAPATAPAKPETRVKLKERKSEAGVTSYVLEGPADR